MRWRPAAVALAAATVAGAAVGVSAGCARHQERPSAIAVVPREAGSLEGSYTSDNGPVPERLRRSTTVTFDGDQATVTVSPGGPQGAVVELDAARRSAVLDAVRTLVGTAAVRSRDAACRDAADAGTRSLVLRADGERVVHMRAVPPVGSCVPAYDALGRFQASVSSALGVPLP